MATRLPCNIISAIATTINSHASRVLQRFTDYDGKPIKTINSHASRVLQRFTDYDG